jgi:hypothetical protein
LGELIDADKFKGVKSQKRELILRDSYTQSISIVPPNGMRISFTSYWGYGERNHYVSLCLKKVSVELTKPEQDLLYSKWEAAATRRHEKRALVERRAAEKALATIEAAILPTP